MNLGLNLNEFSLPIYIEKDSNYYIDLKEQFERYLKHIENVSGIPRECKIKIKKNCQRILDSILQYYDANLVDAEQNIERMLARYVHSAFIVAPISENYAFKGMASEKIRPSMYANFYQAEYEKRMQSEMFFFRSRVAEKRLERKDMLHIPFDNRGIISTQRFSIPGTPCLYFSTTTLGTWLELGMPDADTFQTSAYDLPSDLKILNLCLQQYFLDGAASFINTEQEYRNIQDFLEIFPLTIASSYRIGENNRVFKSEYIISQLIMQSARRLGIDGVAYLTKRMKDTYSYPHGVNLAILMPCNKNIEQRYWEIASEIKLTKPFFMTDVSEDLKKVTEHNSFINKFYAEHVQGEVEVINNVFKYSELNFSDFDEFLWMESKEPFFE